MTAPTLRYLRAALIGVLLSICLPLAANPEPIDKVLILKHERQLQVISQGTVIRQYRVSLGKQPEGHKQQLGDQRTPEGLYTIDWRHHSAQFNLSMHIDYPNLKDRATAFENGVDPGGMIMIHGTPIDEDYPEWFFHGLDWTDGCIALPNADMQELWDLVPNGTLVEIRP
ncbi:L,D-transpeptidase family protein [Halopseudomonas salegens]|uniref:L,D-transpeptidase catalytic domain n=1 Tax=Halopseudomonas salegens TaxID=1434072 RepID=A0A1H2EBN8_9GAMM|nr:L,D-transpeptidase catalytic domain [Halopseudomonas salegens]